MKNYRTSGMSNTWLLIGIAALILALFWFFEQSNTPNEAVTNNSNDSVPTTENLDESMETMDSESTPMADEAEQIRDEPAEEEANSGTYTDYDPSLLANAADGKVVLFFHASWCPSCRALEKNVEANLSSIPSDITILVVDYDSETELKKKYGVTRQHTLVQVDANGNKIQTLTGLTNTLDQVVGQL